MHQISAEEPSNSKLRFSQDLTPAGVMDNPLSNTGNALGSLKNVLRLSRRFQIYRRLIGIRAKTLVRILLTKWWSIGLEFFERELLEALLRESRVLPEYFLLRGLNSSRLDVQVEQYYFHEKSQEWCFPELFKLIYNCNQMKAVCGLRRIKKFFSLAFEKRGPEQSGRPKLKRARIRGYRDGKGKPMDQGLKSRSEANLFYYNLIDRIFHDEVERMILDCAERGPFSEL